jgi:hypothetical protein
MPQLRRRLLTLYPPMLVSTFVALQLAVEEEFPGAVLEYGEMGGPIHVVVTEQVADDDIRLIRVPAPTEERTP